MAYSRYVGLSWDGRGKAAVGFDHAAAEALRDRSPPPARGLPQLHRLRHPRGEPAEGRLGRDPLPQLPLRELRHGPGAFSPSTTTTTRSTAASSATAARACSTTRATSTPATAISRAAARPTSSSAASTAARSAAARRSARGGSSKRPGTIAPVTIQDCHVAGWTDPEGAVHLARQSRCCMFDCCFSRPPSDRPPVTLVNAGQNAVAQQQPARGASSGWCRRQRLSPAATRFRAGRGAA